MFNLTKQVHVSLSFTRLIEWYTEICFQIEVTDGLHNENWSDKAGNGKLFNELEGNPLAEMIVKWISNKKTKHKHRTCETYCKRRSSSLKRTEGEVDRQECLFPSLRYTLEREWSRRTESSTVELSTSECLQYPCCIPWRRRPSAPSWSSRIS